MTIPIDKLPKTIRIGGFDLVIKDFQPPDIRGKQLRGELHWHEQAMALDLNDHPVLLAETIIHELLHGIYRAYSLYGKDDEERTVEAIGVGVLQIVRDNPKLMKALAELLKR